MAVPVPRKLPSLSVSPVEFAPPERLNCRPGCSVQVSRVSTSLLTMRTSPITAPAAWSSAKEGTRVSPDVSSAIAGMHRQKVAAEPPSKRSASLRKATRRIPADAASERHMRSGSHSVSDARMYGSLPQVSLVLESLLDVSGACSRDESRQANPWLHRGTLFLLSKKYTQRRGANTLRAQHVGVPFQDAKVAEKGISNLLDET